MSPGYRNPVLRGVNADPSVCRQGEEYLLATSSMDLEPGLPIYRSRDLLHWRLAGHGLAGPPGSIQGPRMIYAPTLRSHGGRLYLVSTDVAGSGNFLLRAEDPAGPWDGPRPIDVGAFDPSLCFASDGRCYYTRRGRMADKDIVQAEIDPASGRLLTPLRSIATGFVSDDAEGPHLYEIDGRFYLLLAEGGSRALHMTTVGRSDNPWGPFAPCPWNPILAQHHAWWHEILGAGHGDLVEAHDGSWWIVFLATRHPSYDALSHLGRETLLAPVTWRDGWPWVHPAPTRRLAVDAPTLPLEPWPARPVRDDFDSPHLDGGWVSVAPPSPRAAPLLSQPPEGSAAAEAPAGPWWSLAERPGWLRLRPGLGRVAHGAAGDGASSGSDHRGAGRRVRREALLLRRQEDLRFAAAAQLDLGQGDGLEAGLCVYQTAEYRYDLVVASGATRRVALLRRRVGDLLVETRPVVLADGPVRVQVAADAEDYRFAVTDAAGVRHELGSAATRLIASELARAWSGALVGLCASAPESGSVVADFDWFDYAGEDEPVSPAATTRGGSVADGD